MQKDCPHSQELEQLRDDIFDLRDKKDGIPPEVTAREAELQEMQRLWMVEQPSLFDKDFSHRLNIEHYFLAEGHTKLEQRTQLLIAHNLGRIAGALEKANGSD